MPAVQEMLNDSMEEISLACDFLIAYCIGTRQSRVKTVHNLAFDFLLAQSKVCGADMGLIGHLMKLDKGQQQGQVVHLEPAYALGQCDRSI